jgi:hypothetical protein
MKKAKFFLSLIVAAVMVFAPMSAVFADSPLIRGKVTYVEVDTDANTGTTTVLVAVEDETKNQTVRINLKPAIDLHLVTNDGEQVVIVKPLPAYIEIKPEFVIPDEEETQHPVGSALATFFAEDFDGMESDEVYGLIMDAHEAGNGFGVIAQALWLTRKLAAGALEEEESELPTASDIFAEILQAKQDGDYSAFYPEDGPSNWGQFRKAVMDGEKKANLGAVMPLHADDDGSDTATNNGNGNKDKTKIKSNNGNRNGNGQGQNNGNRP